MKGTLVTSQKERLPLFSAYKWDGGCRTEGQDRRFCLTRFVESYLRKNARPMFTSRILNRASPPLVIPRYEAKLYRLRTENTEEPKQREPLDF